MASVFKVKSGHNLGTERAFHVSTPIAVDADLDLLCAFYHAAATCRCNLHARRLVARRSPIMRTSSHRLLPEPFSRWGAGVSAIPHQAADGDLPRFTSNLSDQKWRVFSTAQDKWLRGVIAQNCGNQAILITQFRGARKTTCAQNLTWFGFFLTLPRRATGFKAVHFVRYVPSELYYKHSSQEDKSSLFRDMTTLTVQAAVSLTIGLLTIVYKWWSSDESESLSSERQRGGDTGGSRQLAEVQATIVSHLWMVVEGLAYAVLAFGVVRLASRHTVIFDDVTKIPKSMNSVTRDFVRNTVLKEVEGKTSKHGVILLSSNEGLHFAFSDTNESVRETRRFPAPSPAEVVRVVNWVRAKSTSMHGPGSQLEPLTIERLRANVNFIGWHLGMSIRTYRCFHSTDLTTASWEELVKVCCTVDLMADPPFRHLAIGMSPTVKLSDYGELAGRLGRLRWPQGPTTAGGTSGTGEQKSAAEPLVNVAVELPVMPPPTAPSPVHANAHAGPHVVARAQALNAESLGKRELTDEVPRRLALALLLMASASSLADIVDLSSNLKVVDDDTPNTPFNAEELRCATQLRKLRRKIEELVDAEREQEQTDMLERAHPATAAWVAKVNRPLWFVRQAPIAVLAAASGESEVEAAAHQCIVTEVIKEQGKQ